MALKVKKHGENWKIIYSENQSGEKILWDVTGTGESFSVPEDIVEIRKRTFDRENCPGLKRVIIPKSVHTVQKGAFFGFGSELEVLCRSQEKPEGFFEGEYEEVFTEDGAPYYITHYGSWLCRSVVLRSRDAEGRLTWASIGAHGELAARPVVSWGYAG